MVLGDFNEIISAHEKIGGKPIDMHRCLAFQQNFQDLFLGDIGFMGAKFTWRGHEKRGFCIIFLNVDRAVSTELSVNNFLKPL